MSTFISENTWTYNCPPGPNDLDFNVYWNAFTIQRTLLRKIIRRGNFYNTKEESWDVKESIIEYNPPTSLEQQINAFAFTWHRAKNNNPYPISEYWGKRYELKGELYIIYGQEQALADEEYISNVNGCLRNGDSHYVDMHGCTPPNVECEEP